LRRRFLVFAGTIQSLLFFGHWFVYETWVRFSGVLPPGEIKLARLSLAILSVSFVSSSILAFRFNNLFIRVFYTLAATWIGFLNFLALAAASCWILYALVRAFHLPVTRPQIGLVLFGAAILVSLYGLLNAWAVRTKHISVKLPNLPESWRGRTAALVTDVHLGHVRARFFMQRVINLLRRNNPDIVFISGDLYDGGNVNPGEVVSPWKSYSPPFGAYFVTGNHEGFTNPAKYVQAVSGAGIRPLNSGLALADGLQILGVSYSDMRSPESFRAAIQNSGLDPSRASILLLHVPQNMEISEPAGISLQLSGHTHGGQLFPFTWFTRRVFRQYTYGLHPFGNLMVYTSYGAGTWGPPMRVGTRPEIVLIHFQ